MIILQSISCYRNILW